MTEDEVQNFGERMKAARAAKAAEREAAIEAGELEPDSEPKPKRRYAKRKTARKSRAASTKPPSLRTPIKAMLETVGGVWHMQEMMRGHYPLDESHPTCGSVLLEQADQIATNLNTLAQTDPNVYRWLDRMMAGGGWGGVVLATWPVAAAVLQAHVMPRFQRAEEEPSEGPEGIEQAWPPEPS
jgi:hypothetical protein